MIFVCIQIQKIVILKDGMVDSSDIDIIYSRLGPTIKAKDINKLKLDVDDFAVVFNFIIIDNNVIIIF